MKNLMLAIPTLALMALLSGCGGGSSSEAIAPTPTTTASTFTSAAMAGELLTYTVDTTALTYSYTITESQYGLTGRTGSGTLIRNADGTYTPSGITNAKVAVLPNGILLGAIRESINGVLTTVPIYGLSSPVTTIAAAAGTYNYVQRYCIAGACSSDYGTFRIASPGVWTSCELGNLTTGCTGNTNTGTLNSLGGGKWQVLNGATVIGTAFVQNASGQNVIVLDLNNAANGLGLLVGSQQQAVTTTQTNGTWWAASSDAQHARFSASGPTISYQTINGVASTATTAMTLNSPWSGFVSSASGGYGLLAGSGVYAFQNTGGYAEIGVKLN
jgi:hypothetical protein